MTSDGKNGDAKSAADVISFPYSRVAPRHACEPESPVVYGALAELIGVPHEQTTGHWCSNCRKIWYGYLLEVACPTCGNRHG